MKQYLTAAVTAAALFGLSIVTPAQAGEKDASAVRTIEIAFADLDLSQSTDMHVLQTRVDRAVRKLCPARIEVGVRTLPDHRVCRKTVRENAARQLASLRTRVLAGDSPARRLAISTTEPKG